MVHLNVRFRVPISRKVSKLLVIYVVDAVHLNVGFMTLVPWKYFQLLVNFQVVNVPIHERFMTLITWRVSKPLPLQSDVQDVQCS